MSNTVNNYTETDLGNISLNPRGEYDNSAAYEYLDTVSYRGGSYFCRAELETTITGIAPDAGRDSEHWQMIAAPGDMTPEYTAAHNDVIKKAVQVETSRAAVELAQQEIEAVQTDVQQLHSDTVQATQEAENSKNSAANSAQSAEQSRKTVSESEQNINGQIAGFDSRVSEAVEQSKEEINTTKQQAINTITNQQTTSVNTVKTEGEKIITRVGNDAKTVADDRATVEEATQTVLNNAQEVAQNTQTVASNTENAAASAEGAKTSADNAAQSAKSVEDASKQIEQNKKDVDSLKEDMANIKKKKNVVIYVGSSELSAEQKLSCDYICDGVDDQIEINQAIDSLPDSGGEIHLSRGIFNISNTICISKRIKLVGEGKGITLDRNNVNDGGTTLLSELTGGCIIQIQKSDTLSDIKGITLSDFQIVGAGINVENNYCNGINVTTYTDCVTLERLAICHCFYGLFVDQSATVDDISITNCDFQRDSCGIYIYGKGWQTRIENNIFWDMSGRQSTSGIVLSDGKNIVSGNYFGVSSLVNQDRTNAWISAKNAVSLLCNGNSFSRCTSSPIRFEAGGQFASISGNSFSEIGKAQFQANERAVLYVDGAGTGGGRIAFTNNTVYWTNGDDWKTSYLAYLTNQVAQVNISNNTVIDGIGKITENELVYKSEDSAYAITIGNNVLC